MRHSKRHHLQPKWLEQQLTFPFTATREDDDDDAYFSQTAAKALFRLGHQMQVIGLEGDDVDLGILVKVNEKNRT